MDLTRFGPQSQRSMLDATGVTLSVQACRRLGRELRARFKKHTPPISYIRIQDPRRVRGAARA